jgi:hypothetical protein
MSNYRKLGLAATGLLVLPGPAFAGTVTVPAPLAGIGLPALVLVGGGYWLARKLFALGK